MIGLVIEPGPWLFSLPSPFPSRNKPPPNLRPFLGEGEGGKGGQNYFFPRPIGRGMFELNGGTTAHPAGRVAPLPVAATTGSHHSW